MTDRKNTGALTANEWDKLVSAMQCLKSRKEEKRWKTFMTDHRANYHSIHTTEDHGLQLMFLPWHRQFILEFEQSLQAYASGTFLPYWDWPNEARIPDAFGKKLLGWMHTPRKIRFTRNINNKNWPTQSQVDDLMSISDFSSFSSSLENTVHNAVHRVIGGKMSTRLSPKDPLFFIHHVMVDKLWADWQKIHDEYTWSNPDERLPEPYSDITVQSILDSSDLGVQYLESVSTNLTASQSRNKKRENRETSRNNKKVINIDFKNDKKAAKEVKKQRISDAKKLSGTEKRKEKKAAKKDYKDSKKAAKSKKREDRKNERIRKKTTRKAIRYQRKSGKARKAA